jgi:hypothetical protein
MQSEIYLVDNCFDQRRPVVIRTSKYSTEVKISEPLPLDAGVVTINKNGGAWKQTILCRLIDWLIIYGFTCTSCSRIFHLYGDVTIAGEGLQNLGLCSALRAFEQEGIFIVSHLLWHRTSVFLVSSEGPPHSVTSYDTRGDMEDLF